MIAHGAEDLGGFGVERGEPARQRLAQRFGQLVAVGREDRPHLADVLRRDIAGPGRRVRLGAEREPQPAEAQVAELQLDDQLRAAGKAGERRLEFEDRRVVFLGRRPHDPGRGGLAIDGVGQRLVLVFERREDRLELQRLRRVFRLRIERPGRDFDLGQLKTAVAVQARPALRQRLVGEGVEPQRRARSSDACGTSADTALRCRRSAARPRCRTFAPGVEQAVVGDDPAGQLLELRTLGFEVDRLQHLPARRFGLLGQLRAAARRRSAPAAPSRRTSPARRRAARARPGAAPGPARVAAGSGSSVRVPCTVRASAAARA